MTLPLPVHQLTIDEVRHYTQGNPLAERLFECLEKLEEDNTNLCEKLEDLQSQIRDLDFQVERLQEELNEYKKGAGDA